MALPLLLPLPLPLLLLLSAGTASVRGQQACPKVAVAGVETYTIYSHEGYNSGAKYSHNASCEWSAPAPDVSSAWELRFGEVDLESSVTSRQCKYDNLTVTFVNSQPDSPPGMQVTTVLCGKHYNLLLLTKGAFTIKFQSDASISQRGFRITWRMVSRAEAVRRLHQISPVFRPNGSAGSCSSLESSEVAVIEGSKYSITRVNMSVLQNTYLHNADCTWNIVPSNGSAVYVTFGVIHLEGNSPCTLDNLTVTYRLPGRALSQRRVLCFKLTPLQLVSLGPVTIQLQTDSSVGNQMSFKWFVAPISRRVSLETSQLFKEDACPPVVRTPDGGEIRYYFDPPLTYEPRTRCSWVVTVPVGMMAEFSFVKFQLTSRYYRPWHRGNNSMFYDCSHRDDSVRINAIDGSQLGLFCYKSPMSLGQVVVTAFGTALVHFISNELRTSHGFILKYSLKGEIQNDPQGFCPKVQILDPDSQLIKANQSLNRYRWAAYPVRSCSWILKEPGPNHMLSLSINGAGTRHIADRSSFVPHEYSHYTVCRPRLVIESQAYVGGDGNSDWVSKASGKQPRAFKREFCHRGFPFIVGPFAGRVNVSLVNMRGSTDLHGFSVLAIRIPKPTAGCSTTRVKTETYKNRTVKIFNITGRAGCIVSEALSGFSDIYYNSQLNVTFELSCSLSASSRMKLTVLGRSFLAYVRCGNRMVVSSSARETLILKFPPGTDATLISKVTYNYPVMETFCQKMNPSAPADATSGAFLLPLIVTVNVSLFDDSPDLVSCHYNLPYRQGYSILLKISHNLGYDELDFFCQLNSEDKRPNSHIILVVRERDTDSVPGDWVETELDLCHGDEVGSLVTKSEVIVDGSAAISLLAVSDRLVSTNSSTDGSPLNPWRLLNRTEAQNPNFLITYQYIPFCPELTCRTTKGREDACPIRQMAKVVLQAQLLTGIERTCTRIIPTSESMQAALFNQSNSWNVKLEISNFSTSCPCHGCDADDSKEFITVDSPRSDKTAAKKLIVCGNNAGKSVVLNTLLDRNAPRTRISYRLLGKGATVRVSFLDCQTSQCPMKQAQDQLLISYQTAEPDRGSLTGLVLAAVLLAAVLVACLVYINRQALISSGSRIQ